MPDPNAHADGLLSPAFKHELPPLWWMNPWYTAKALLDALDLASLDLLAERNKAKDFEQRWLEANEALLKEQGDHDDTSDKLHAAKAEALGYKEAKAAAHKVIDDIYAIVPGKAYNADGLIENIRLLIPKPADKGEVLAEDKVTGCTLYAPKAKRKAKAKKKAVRRG
jgi:hypothetical protein